MIAGLEKFTDPRLIPLPSSPPSAPRSLPSRRPEGWISVIPRLSSGRFRIPSSRFTRRDRSEVEDATGSNMARVHGLTGEGVSSPSSEAGLAGLEAVAAAVEGGQKTSASDARPGREASTCAPAQHREVGSTSTNRRYGNLGRRPSSGHFPGWTPRHPTRPASTVQANMQRSASDIPASQQRNQRQVSGTMQYAMLPSFPPSLLPIENQSLRNTSLGSRRTAVSTRKDHDHYKEAGSSSRISSLGTTEDSEILTPLPELDDGRIEPRVVLAQDADEVSRVSEANELITADGPDPLLDNASWEAGAPLESLTGTTEGGEEDDEEMERPEWLDEVLAERQADEQWMSQVRDQLSCLFPDFLPAEQQILDPTLRDEDILVEAAGVTAPGVGQLNVRDEMRELREEMERLRSVVGRLANGLQNGPGAANPAVEAMMSSGEDQRRREQVISEHDIRVGMGDPAQIHLASLTRSGAPRATAVQAGDKEHREVSQDQELTANQIPGKMWPVWQRAGRLSQTVDRENDTTIAQLLAENSEAITTILIDLDKFINPCPTDRSLAAVSSHPTNRTITQILEPSHLAALRFGLMTKLTNVREEDEVEDSI